jgi:hypothetical protein
MRGGDTRRVVGDEAVDDADAIMARTATLTGCTPGPNHLGAIGPF